MVEILNFLKYLPRDLVKSAAYLEQELLVVDLQLFFFDEVVCFLEEVLKLLELLHQTVEPFILSCCLLL